MQRQRGIAGGLIALVVLLVIVGVLATQVLSRIGTSGRASDAATSKLASLADAIEQYAASAGRLPCPADPSLDNGDEAVPSPNVGACTFPEGTVPWKTVGARREDAIDPWGWKVSYRVFRGTAGVAGSLTQAGGATMVECDTVDPGAGATTPVAGVSGGLCVSNADPTLRSTTDASFRANKGLALNDSGTANTDVAYVLLSHGPTGRGAYTSGGVRTEMPLGDELNNTAAAGPFMIKAFSDAGTDPSTAAHFDDRLYYRTLPELMRRTSLGARDWPEPPPPAPAGQVTFDQATIEAAVGTTVTPGASVGSVTVTFVGVVVTGSGSSGSDVGFDVIGGVGGIGVAGGGSALLQSSFNETLSFAISGTATKFGVTLNDFGIYSGTFVERVQFRFFLGATEVVPPKVGAGCRADGGLASFEADIGTDFDRIDVTPLAALDTDTFTFTGITALLVSQGRACPSTEPTCATSLAAAGNICPL